LKHFWRSTLDGRDLLWKDVLSMEQSGKPTQVFPKPLIDAVHAYLSSLPQSTPFDYDHAAEALRRAVVYYNETLIAVQSLLAAEPQNVEHHAIAVLSSSERALANGFPPEGFQELCQSACRNVILRCAGDVTVQLRTALNGSDTEQWKVADDLAHTCEQALDLLTWDCDSDKISVAGGLLEQRERYRKKMAEGAAQAPDPAN